MRYVLIFVILLFVPVCQADQPQESINMQENLTSELFLRIVKTTPDRPKGYLEAWRRSEDGTFALDRTFDICTWSGALRDTLRR